MATYVPGIPNYMPTWKTFTPDYKFLSDVLETKTNRYNTNHKAINDRYSKVVYADLSRKDTNSLRDQYANNLGPQMEKIAGIDLSIMQNADAAKALFKPFYEEDIIVKDLVHTKNLATQQRQAEAMRTSSDDEVRRRYWPTGMELLQFKHQDFINATEEEALTMPLQKFVPDADLYNMTMKYLEGQGYNVTLPSESPDGKWIVKKTNGAVITKQALADATAALADDPLVRKAYEADAYVRSRKHADKAMEKGSATSVTEGMAQWGRTEIENTTKQIGTKVIELEKQKVYLSKQKGKWDKYDKKYGVIPGSPDDVNRQKILSALDATNVDINRYTKAAEEATQLMTDGDDKQIINRAYNVFMANNINGDIAEAALNYSNKTKKVELEVNQYKMNEIKFNQDIYLKNLGHQHRMGEIKFKQDLEDAAKEEENRLAQAVQNILTGGTGSSIGDATTPLGILNPNYVTDYQNGVVKDNTELVNDEAQAVAVLLTENSTDEQKQSNEYVLDGEWAGEGATIINNDDGTVTTKVSGVNLQSVLANEQNRKAFQNLYEIKSSEVGNMDKQASPDDKGVIANNFNKFRNLRDRRFKLEDADTKYNEMLYKNWLEYQKNYQEFKDVKGTSEPDGWGTYFEQILLGTPLSSLYQQGKKAVGNLTEEDEIVEIEKYKTVKAAANGLFKTNADGKNPKLRTEEEYANYIMKENPKLGESVRALYQETGWSNIPRAYLGYTSVGAKLPAARATDEELKTHLIEQYKAYVGTLNKATSGRFNIPTSVDDVEGASQQYKGGTWSDVHDYGSKPGKAGDILQHGPITQVITPGSYNLDQVAMLDNYVDQLKNGQENIYRLADGEIADTEKVERVLAYANEHLLRGSGQGEQKEALTIVYNKMTPGGDPDNPDPTNPVAAYTIKLNPQVVKDLTTTSSGSAQTNILDASELANYSTIKIEFPLETDLSTYSVENQKFSAVDYKLKASKNGSYSETIPNGGSYTVRHTAGGVWIDIQPMNFKKGGDNNAWGMYEDNWQQHEMGNKKDWDKNVDAAVATLLKFSNTNTINKRAKALELQNKK